MKKLFTLAVTMLLAGALSFAQADKTGSTDKKGGTTTTDAGSRCNACATWAKSARNGYP